MVVLLMGIIDTIVLDDEQRESETFRPIYRLCCAMLFKAYEDIEDYDNPKSSRYIYAKTAESWIFGDSTDAPIPLSFVCTILNLRKEEIQEKAILIKAHKLSVKQDSPLKPSVPR